MLNVWAIGMHEVAEWIQIQLGSGLKAKYTRPRLMSVPFQLIMFHPSPGVV